MISIISTAATKGVVITDAVHFHWENVNITAFSKAMVLAPTGRVAYCSYRNLILQSDGTTGNGVTAGLSFELIGGGFANQNDFYNCRFLSTNGNSDHAVVFDDSGYNANHFMFCVWELTFTIAKVKFGAGSGRNVIYGCRFEGGTVGVIDPLGTNIIHDFGFLQGLTNTFNSNSFLITRDEMNIPTKVAIDENRTLFNHAWSVTAPLNSTTSVPIFLIDHTSGATATRLHFFAKYYLPHRRSVSTHSTDSFRGIVEGIIGDEVNGGVTVAVDQFHDHRTDDRGLYGGELSQNDLTLTFKMITFDSQAQLHAEFVNTNVSTGVRLVTSEFNVEFGANASGNVATITPQDDTDSLLSVGVTTIADDFVVLTTNGDVGIRTTAPSANLHIASETQTDERIRLSGQEFFAASNTSDDGIALLLGINRSSNRQLWIADSANTAINATNAVVRIQPRNSGSEVTALATNGTTRLKLQVEGNPLTLNEQGATIGIDGSTSPDISLAIVEDDTGINHPDTDVITIENNGSESMRVDAIGNVGIGVTNISANLQIASTTQTDERVRLSGQEFFQSSNTSEEGISLLLGINRSNNRQLWVADSANLAQNATNAVVRIQPTNSGSNVTALATNGTTRLKLQVEGNPLTLNEQGATIGIDGSTDPDLSFSIVEDDTGINHPATDVITIENNGSETARFDAIGNVGIGITNIDANLHIASETQLVDRLRLSGQEFFAASNTSEDGIAFILGINRTNNRQLFIADSANTAVNATNATIRLQPNNTSSEITALATNAATRLKLQVAGNPLTLNESGDNVGIGTNSPSHALHINGTTSAVDGNAILLDAAFGDGVYINVGTVGRNIGVFSTGNLFMGYNVNYDATSNSYEYAITDQASSIEWNVAGDITFNAKVSGTAGNEFVMDESMRIFNNGNVGIGTNITSATLLLELNSTTGALLITRMTTTQRDAMTPTVNGMIIYNTTTGVFNFFEGFAWVTK